MLLPGAYRLVVRIGTEIGAGAPFTVQIASVYGRATRCPVLRAAMGGTGGSGVGAGGRGDGTISLRACYAMSGTDLAHGASRATCTARWRLRGPVASYA
eukprot:2036697-Rhodomonas_salina.3